MWPFKKKEKEIIIPYRTIVEPAGIFFDKNKNIVVCTAYKHYGYWGELLDVKIHKDIIG